MNAEQILNIPENRPELLFESGKIKTQFNLLAKQWHPEIRSIADRYYKGIVTEQWHFNIETEAQLDIRLTDVEKKPEPPKCPTNERNDSYLRKY